MTLFKNRGYLQLKVTIIGHNELSLITFWDHFLFILTCVISGASVAHVTSKKGVHVKCARHLRTYFLTVYGGPMNEICRKVICSLRRMFWRHHCCWRHIPRHTLVLCSKTSPRDVPRSKSNVRNTGTRPLDYRKHSETFRHWAIKASGGLGKLKTSYTTTTFTGCTFWWSYLRIL